MAVLFASTFAVVAPVTMRTSISFHHRQIVRQSRFVSGCAARSTRPCSVVGPAVSAHVSHPRRSRCSNLVDPFVEGGRLLPWDALPIASPPVRSPGSRGPRPPDAGTRDFRRRERGIGSSEQLGVHMRRPRWRNALRPRRRSMPTVDRFNQTHSLHCLRSQQWSKAGPFEWSATGPFGRRPLTTGIASPLSKRHGVLPRSQRFYS
jgi:hypothetical protein